MPQRRVTWLLAAAAAVSVVHYVDNAVAYDAYPQSTTLPNPSVTTIVVAWFVFTAFGLAGWLALRRGRDGVAAACLAVYALSGIIGIGHYLAPGTGTFPWWRHAHVVADIVLGVLVLLAAVRLLERSTARSAAGSGRSSRSPR